MGFEKPLQMAGNGEITLPELSPHVYRVRGWHPDSYWCVGNFRPRLVPFDLHRAETANQ